MAAAEENQISPLVQQRLEQFPDFVVGRTYDLEETYLNRKNEAHEIKNKFHAELINLTIKHSHLSSMYTLKFKLIQERSPNYDRKNSEIRNFTIIFKVMHDIPLKNTSEFINIRKTIGSGPAHGFLRFFKGAVYLKVSTDDGKLIGFRDTDFFHSNLPGWSSKEIPHKKYPYHVITITGRRDIEHNLAIESMGQNIGAHIGQYLPGGKKRSKSKKTKKTKRGRKNTKKRQTKKNRNKRTMRKK